jgi:cytochrome c oxidase assembly factor CtaG
LALGAALLLAVLASPLETLASEYLLSAHLVQNVVLAEWAPALLVLAVAPATAASLARLSLVRLLARPYVALPIWLATYGVWHVPVCYDAALRHPDWLLPLEHLSYVLAGLVFWWPIFQRRPWQLRSGAKAGYIFAAFLTASPIGLLLALLPAPVYSFYEQAPRLWELSALRDQQIAGVLMAGTEAIVFFALFATFFLRFLDEEDRAPAASSMR